MKGCLAWTLIVSALCAGCAAQKHNNICDTCKCLPSAHANEAKSIECFCNATTKTITTTVANMKDLPHLESFTVVNCEAVTFQQRSFANTHDLSDVILKNVKTASFPLGVFAKLDSLKIEDVDDLKLMTNAFLGAEIGEIAIRNSTIHEIPELALYNVKLRKLELSDVNIGTIKSNSTLFVMGEQSNLFIERCKVNRVESKGLQIKAQKLRISGTTLTNLAPSSTIIDAAISLDIFSTTFGDSDPEAMHISSKTINIFNNTFFNIPITIANADAGGKVSVKNNVINKLAFHGNVLTFLKAEFIRNSFFCTCQFSQDLETAESLAAHFLPNFDSILSNNYCQSNCSKKLSVKDFFQRAKESCSSGAVDLCEADGTGDVVDPDASGDDGDDGDTNAPAVSGRSGRQDDHEEPQEDPHDDNAATAGSARSASSAKYQATSLLIMTFLVVINILK